MNENQFTIALSPQGSLYFLSQPETPFLKRIQKSFQLSLGRGLLELGLTELNTELPPDLAYWRELSRLFFSHLTSIPGLSEIADPHTVQLPPPSEELELLSHSAPPMMGGEYLNGNILSHFWEEIRLAFIEALSEELPQSPNHENYESHESHKKTHHFTSPIQTFFERHGAAWNLVGRVCFHLAENKANPNTPFAFLATYSHKLSDQGKIRHIPLGKALQEYAGENNRPLLLQLLLPVQKATQNSSFLKNLVDSGEIFHPLAWSPQDAFHFLKDIPVYESSGVIVRIPDWWRAKKPPRPQVSVKIGKKKSSALGLDSLLDFSTSVTLEGEDLTQEELKQILSSTDGLILIRGKWVEVDHDQLKEVLAHWKNVEHAVEKTGGISFIEGMRLLSGTGIGEVESDGISSSIPEWSQVIADQELSNQLQQLREPDGQFKNPMRFKTEFQLNATLRPYQQVGVQWLWLLNRLGLGSCLADDMGLGKTIQVISLLLLLKGENEKLNQIKNLLIVPASLIGNWKSELDRFAPSLRYFIAHPSATTGRDQRDELGQPSPSTLSSTDVVITTYSYVSRLAWLSQTQWNLLVIDEAQAIKNPGSKQAQAVKALKSRHRIALTGTPIENHLSDLWSLYDFLCPGLLGTSKEFERFVKKAERDKTPHRYAALRNLVQPYFLRRTKTDKKIIADLPEKTEYPVYCPLTKIQAALYQQSVEELAQKIETVKEGIQRRGLIFSFLTRFKQICNHPSQLLSDGRYEPTESGKFARLHDICEEISAKQEKALIFTQFREMTGPISNFLSEVFGRPGLVLHGETAIKKRKELVDSFQQEQGPPFFVLSLKAGGTGLNLTAASHVIHFDRWWNPAVENQATDRAFRIGQKKNVLVHKLICRGTIEERIDELIQSKQSLSEEILKGGQEVPLTELSNPDLLKLVSLDIRTAVTES